MAAVAVWLPAVVRELEVSQGGVRGVCWHPEGRFPGRLFEDFHDKGCLIVLAQIAMRSPLPSSKSIATRPYHCVGWDSRQAPRGTWKRFVEQNRFNIISYGALIVSVLFVWHLFSDGDFSFLMTLGGLMRLFAFVLIIVKLVQQRQCAGVSLKTMQAYAAVFVFRLCSVLIYEGYLPFDRSGDWFYQFVELTALCLVITIIYLMTNVYKESYQRVWDRFGTNWVAGIPPHLGAIFLIVPCFVFALVFHPSLNGNFLTDTAWTAALYLEAVAIVPQLYLFQSRGGEVETFNASAVFSLAVARALHLVFWMSSFHELNDQYARNFHQRYPGYLVVFCQILNLLIMGNFCRLYVMAAKTGGQMRLPLPT